MLLRFLFGLLLAAAFAAAAARANALSLSGAVAATVVGAVAVAAGWSWAVVLIVFFVLTSSLSAHGGARKSSLLAAVTVKARARDAIQVLANGGWYAAAAIGWMMTGSAVWLAAGGGAIAAAAADSWATELGVLYGGSPREIVTGRRTARGLSGGVTAVGSAGGAAGAAAMAVTMLTIGWPLSIALSAAFAGVAGMHTDSILGATLQARRVCPSCAVETEQTVHRCGTVTVPTRGLQWMDNDLVNALSILVGAATAALMFSATR